MTFAYDRILDIDCGSIANLSAYIPSAVFGTRALVVSGKDVWTAFGDEVARELKKKCEFDVVIAESNSIDLAMSLAQKSIVEDIDYLVGVGEGRCIDVGKYAVYVSMICFKLSDRQSVGSRRRAVPPLGATRPRRGRFPCGL